LKQRTVAKRVAVVPGDDAVPEAVYAALMVLQALELPIEWSVLPDGETLARTLSREESERLLREAADGSDALLFGALSGKTGGIGYFRWGKQTYANVRPVRWRQGAGSPLRSPEGIDYVIVRENLEDLLFGCQGRLEDLDGSAFAAPEGRPVVQLAGRDGGYAVKVITRAGTERVAHFACRLALARKALGYPGKVTCAAKYNALRESDGLFRAVVEEVVQQYPELNYEQFLIDDFARRLVASPHGLDVVVLPNLYGDILSDEAAGTIGGLGLAPSGCYGDSWAYFEPAHGTAPDIAGRHVINPTATLLSGAMLLEYLGFSDEAAHLEEAVTRTYAAGDRLTPDQGGGASTEKFAEAVRSRL
jgi:isocitrate/isopropylmalate dehydrogenase